MFGMSDEEFIRNRREMFYDKRYEVLWKQLVRLKAAATADLNAGPDAGLGGEMGRQRCWGSRSRQNLSGP